MLQNIKQAYGRENAYRQGRDSGATTGATSLASAKPNAGDLGTAPIDHAVLAEYADPAGERIAKAAASAWHDIAAQQTDPAIAARLREEAKLRAEAPLRGANKTGVAQDGTMGLGLFDASDQAKFDLGDSNGEQTLKQIYDAIGDDRNALDAINGCLKE